MGDDKSISAGEDVTGSTLISGNQNIVGNNNLVIHISDKVFDTDQLRQLVSATLDVDGLHALRNKIFLTQEPVYREQVTFEALIEEFKAKNELSRLFSAVEKVNPDAFRKFMLGQVLRAIGVSTKNIPDASIFTEETAQELSLTGGAAKFDLPGAEIYVPFVNKDSLFTQIHNHINNYIVVYGPGGVGKTYFLQNFQEKFKDTRCVYIDLKNCNAENILSEAVRQLNNAEELDQKTTYRDLASAINAVHVNNPQITRFFFLFDSSDKNQDAVDFIFQPDSLIENKTFRKSLRNRRVYDRIEIKIVLAARKQIKPRVLNSPFQQSVQIKYEALNRDSVQTMLEDIANKNEILVFPDKARVFSNKVFYLTGGHPGCVKPMLLALHALDYDPPEPETWVELYRKYVLPVIEDEMLSGIKKEIQLHIWNLCIFRRLDQRLLGGLIDRGILSCPPGENSRMARELRPQLEQTQLFEVDRTTSTMVMNYTLRHALSLNMQYESPERYKALHALALEMFLDRLQNPDITSNRATERTIMHLFEIVYHWTKYLELEIDTAERIEPAEDICGRLQNAFANYLLLAFTPFRQSDPIEFLRLLEEWWDKDQELHETIQQITDYGDCFEKMTKLIKRFIQENGQIK